ncbi:MAG: LPS export ABC transporter periplasmic protein LptC [Prevotellaceae bacterium]|jgi:LPS export ABC transporter protein LptC|nr:LPS export ABC transporter periplasmic protein LptC [Prevotellaceae bacterium]
MKTIALKFTVLLLTAAGGFVSCGDDKGKLVDLGAGKEIISTEVHNLDVIYTEYGNTKTLLRTPLLQRYMFNDEPYSVFSKGFFVQLFDEEVQLESQITADYALYKEKPAELWKAVGNVVVINFQKDQTLTTDTLYWNRPEKSIYTDALVRIKTGDGLIIGRNGMTSDEKFSEYEIRAVGDSSYYYYTEQPPVTDSSAIETPQPTIQQPSEIRSSKPETRNLSYEYNRPFIAVILYPFIFRFFFGNGNSFPFFQ